MTAYSNTMCSLSVLQNNLGYAAMEQFSALEFS